MFKSLSWLDFLNAVAVISGSYYAISFLFLYIKELANVHSIKHVHCNSARRDASNIMGAIKIDLQKKEHNSAVNPNEVIISPENPQDSPGDADLEVGPSVSDVLQDIKALTNVIQENSGTETESISKYQALVQRNSHLASSSYKEVINKFIHDQCTNICGFQIEISEVRSWWLNN